MLFKRFTLVENVLNIRHMYTPPIYKKRAKAGSSRNQNRGAVIHASNRTVSSPRVVNKTAFMDHRNDFRVNSEFGQFKSPILSGPTPILRLSHMRGASGQIVQRSGNNFFLSATRSATRKSGNWTAKQTGLPPGLKYGLENLSGISMDHVNVHYNSPRPDRLNAHAYTQGSEIHVAPGQEKHLPHEGWHVVQQAQGRVQPTMQMAGSKINNDEGLEKEADIMGERASVAGRSYENHKTNGPEFFARPKSVNLNPMASPLQRRVGFEYEMGDIRTQHWGLIANWHDHKKGAVLGRHPGFELTADQGDRQSQLEVIINHIDETNQNEVDHLINTTAPAVVAMINNIAHSSYHVWTTANNIAGVNGSSWDRYRSTSDGADGIMGQLQMTGGISMTNLWDHVSGQQATGYLADLNPDANEEDANAHVTLGIYSQGVIAAFAQQEVNGHVILNQLGGQTRNQIAAVAALMATIPYNSRKVGNLPYPKSAAGPLLARTDFSKIMMLLPATAKAAITPQIMRTIVLNTINHLDLPYQIRGGHAVIPITASLPEEAPRFGSLSINNWVGGVVPTPGKIWGYWKGKDQMTQKSYPGSRQQRSWLESLGSYGGKTDRGDKPIFEFRSLGGVFVPDLPGQLRHLLGFMNYE